MPIEYSIRVSSRARHVRLVMTLEGLEVVLPSGVSRRGIPDLVESKREWIERATARVEARKRLLKADPPRSPDRVVLQAVGEEWRLEYRPASPRARAPGARARSTVAAREKPGQRLVVTGDPEDFEACRQALRRWLGRRAREELVPWLAELAREHGLQYQSVSVRQQRTRWGSCSRRKAISLNAKLLLMPSTAVDYVLLHELCHTVEMNHSPRFWALLERHDPDYRAHKKSVRAAARAMPPWLDHGPADEAV